MAKRRSPRGKKAAPLNRLHPAAFDPTYEIAIPSDLNVYTLLHEVGAPDHENKISDLNELQTRILDLHLFKKNPERRPSSVDTTKFTGELLRVLPRILDALKEDVDLFEGIREYHPTTVDEFNAFITVERQATEKLLQALIDYRSKPLYDLHKGPKSWHVQAYGIWKGYLDIYWAGPNTIKPPGYKLTKVVLERTGIGHFTVDAIKRAVERY